MALNFRNIVTKCSGVNCPIKDNCGRFDGRIHRELVTPPFSIKNGLFSCSLFMGDQSNMILKSLFNITGQPDAYCDTYCRHAENCDKIECKLS